MKRYFINGKEVSHSRWQAMKRLNEYIIRKNVEAIENNDWDSVITAGYWMTCEIDESEPGSTLANYLRDCTRMGYC